MMPLPPIVRAHQLILSRLFWDKKLFNSIGRKDNKSRDDVRQRTFFYFFYLPVKMAKD